MQEKTVKLSRRKAELYAKNAEIIKFLRRNPIIACDWLLGIPLIDSQKWILQQSWNTPNVMWTCSRSFGKSFMICVFSMLKMLLYPNIKIYILSNKGSQAQETFIKLEDIAKQRIESISSLTDIFINEVEKNNNSDGFVHDKASFRVSVYGGGTTFTLNSVPDNIRGKRANILIFDESSFCSEELITTALPFITQSSDFKLSTDGNFDLKLLKKEVPNQSIFASSAGDIDSKHAKLYKEYALKMVAGDSNYFSADIPCDIPLAPLYNGEPTKPLLTKQKIDDEMRVNPDKAKREYYNKFQTDGGESQIIKWAAIRRNETFDLPQLANHGDDKFAIAFDPANSDGDNSIISAMKICYNDEVGYYGEMINCTNLIDINKRKKMNMKSTDQTKFLRQMLVDYSAGAKLYYENIEAVLIDAGAGGHGTSYADNLLEDWVDENGIKRPGIIDRNYPKYEEERGYPEAKDIARLISPQKYRTQMVEELIMLMMSDLIKFPKEYNGKPEISMAVGGEKGNGIDIEYRPLSIEEQIALVNLDILKTETTSIHRFGTDINVKYSLPKEKERTHYDDRFYTLIMLAHYLYEIRREDQFSKGRKKRHNIRDYFYSN